MQNKIKVEEKSTLLFALFAKGPRGGMLGDMSPIKSPINGKRFMPFFLTLGNGPKWIIKNLFCLKLAKIGMM